jgi:hypothetical protein
VRAWRPLDAPPAGYVPTEDEVARLVDRVAAAQTGGVLVSVRSTGIDVVPFDERPAAEPR